jgi:uncharacterized protein (TIGR01244 family)
MSRFLLMPGRLACDLLGLRQILHMLLDTLFWGRGGVLLVLLRLAGRSFIRMNIHKLSDQLLARALVRISDLGAIHAANFRSIISNRTDAEDRGSRRPTAHVQLHRRTGLKRGISRSSRGAFLKAKWPRFRAHISELPKAVWAYCRIGARSSSLWKMMAK